MHQSKRKLPPAILHAPGPRHEAPSIAGNEAMSTPPPERWAAAADITVETRSLSIAEAHSIAYALFDEIDKDHDGKISVDEMVSVLHGLIEPVRVRGDNFDEISTFICCHPRATVTLRKSSKAFQFLHVRRTH